MENWPEAGDILEPLDGKSALIQYNPRRESLFTTVIIDEDATGWYLKLDKRGLKCMFAEHDFEEVMERVRRDKEKASVGSLRVLRMSNRGTCLICELVEEEINV